MMGMKTLEDLVNVGVSTSLYGPEEALIKEARQRQAHRKRWFRSLFVVAVIAAVTAIGVTHGGSGGGQGTRTPLGPNGSNSAFSRQNTACINAHSNLSAGTHIVSCGTNGGGWTAR
jgi:hypothetical protein